MNFKLESENSKKSRDCHRKTRIQKTRNSAAWPKAPSTPTRRSQIKAINHDEFAKSCSEWRQRAAGVGEHSIEDMEIDGDIDEETTNLRKVSPRSSTSNIQQKTNITSCQPSQEIDDKRHTLRARRTLDNSIPSPVLPTQTKQSEKNLKSDKNKACVVQKEAKSTTPTDPVKKQNSIFIVIHVNRVVVGNISGRAEKPVKVYADKFMIELENEITKEEVSFRIPCKHITSLQVSLKEKPYMIKFTTKEIQYIKGVSNSKKSRKKDEPENVVLHLAYEDAVPKEVQADLKELFQVRLADQKLWPTEEAQNKDASKTKVCESKKESKKEVDASLLKPVKEKGKVSTTVGQSEAISLTTKSEAISLTTGLNTLSVRKRTPMKKTHAEKEKEESPGPDTNQAKFARRIDNMNNLMEERVKTLTHEAAHYQMVSAQQRMIIQSLEDDVRQKQLLADRKTDELFQERQLSDKLLNEKSLQEVELLNQLKNERDCVKRLQVELEAARKDLLEKNKLLEEKMGAISEKEEKEETVPASAMEETRHHLMQMQVSKENLAVELQQARQDLIRKNSDIETMRIQLQHTRQELQSKDQSLLQVRGDFINTQEELLRKNSELTTLTQQLAESRTHNGGEAGELRSELINTKVELEEAQRELARAKEDLNQTDQLLDQHQNLSRDWILDRGEIIITDKIMGVGAWGNVKVGNFRCTDVAVKQIHLLILSPHNRRLFEREMAIASRCRHPYLVQFIGATNDNGTPLFVMELLETDLRSELSRKALGSRDCVQIGYDVIRALSYLHASRPVAIIHRDISSSNILLYHGKTGWRAKLSDYGSANFMRLSMTQHPGALLYSAPEASTIDQTTKLDVYSFGVLFCEMCTRELPIPEQRQQQVNMVANPDHRLLINNCLRRHTSDRLDSKDAVIVFKQWINDNSLK